MIAILNVFSLYFSYFTLQFNFLNGHIALWFNKSIYTYCSFTESLQRVFWSLYRTYQFCHSAALMSTDVKCAFWLKLQNGKNPKIYLHFLTERKIKWKYQSGYVLYLFLSSSFTEQTSRLMPHCFQLSYFSSY